MERAREPRAEAHSAPVLAQRQRRAARHRPEPPAVTQGAPVPRPLSPNHGHTLLRPLALLDLFSFSHLFSEQQYETESRALIVCTRKETTGGADAPAWWPGAHRFWTRFAPENHKCVVYAEPSTLHSVSSATGNFLPLYLCLCHEHSCCVKDCRLFPPKSLANWGSRLISCQHSSQCAGQWRVEISVQVLRGPEALRASQPCRASGGAPLHHTALCVTAQNRGS